MKKAFVVLLALACSMQCLGEDLRTEEIGFVSHGVTLSGSIVFPAGDIHSAVVFVHGSGKQSRDLKLAERFAKAGIAALVYDKRGAGKSGGEYEGNQNVSEKNIALLADDAAAALKAPDQSSIGIKDVPVGFVGISQAGWIAPVGCRTQRPREIPGAVERAGLQGERGRHLQHLHPGNGWSDCAAVRQRR